MIYINIKPHRITRCISDLEIYYVKVSQPNTLTHRIGDLENSTELHLVFFGLVTHCRGDLETILSKHWAHCYLPHR